jgi:hypothetical protein
MENNSRGPSICVLLAKIDNPINRMILENRKKAKFGKSIGVISIFLGADLTAIEITSKNSFQSLESLGNGVVSTNTFAVLDLVGATFAILTGLFLLRYRHFSKISFSIACGFAAFFGLTLLLMRSIHLADSFLSAISAEAVVALILSISVMFLSIYSG